MDDQLTSPQEEESPKKEEKVKTPWQLQKESWYDKIPLSLKQLDTIIYVCLFLLVLVIIVIALDAMDIFNPFGY